jgi:hypothetical protein
MARRADPGADARTEVRGGGVVAMTIVVVMALTVLGLGLGGAFSHEPQPGDPYGRRPTVAIATRLAGGPATAHAYRLVRPALTLADAQRIFAAAGITARVHADRGSFSTGGQDRAGITKSALGWFVSTFPNSPDTLTSDRAGVSPPSPADAMAVAQRTLTAIGVPTDRVRVLRTDADTASRTVEVDRVVNGTVLAVLGWTVEVGPAGHVDGVSGYVTDVVDAGPLPVMSTRRVARRLEFPRRTTVALPASHALSPLGVIVGMDMLEYGSASDAGKYITLDSDACPFNKLPGVRTDGGFERVGSAFCLFVAPRAVRVTSSSPTLGLVVREHAHDALLVPAYRLRITTSPHATKHAGATVTVVAVAPAAFARLTRLARTGS